MEAAAIDWSMGSRAAVLVDWGTAADAGRRVGGSGPPTPAIERARMREDLAEVVPTAEGLIVDFTGLSADGGIRSRPWATCSATAATSEVMRTSPIRRARLHSR